MCLTCQVFIKMQSKSIVLLITSSFVFTDASISSIDESIESFTIDETFNGSNSGVIENSDNEDNNSTLGENDADDSVEVVDDNKDSSKASVTSDIDLTGNGSDSGTRFASAVSQQDLSQSLVTSDIHISGDESDSGNHSASPDVHNISGDSHTSVEEKKSHESSRIYTIDSSDSDDSIIEVSHSSAQNKIEFKKEPGMKLEADVKMEPRAKLEPGVKFETGVNVKFESGVKSEPGVKWEPGVKSEPSFATGSNFESDFQAKALSKVNPFQLVNDVKPIHTGKLIISSVSGTYFRLFFRQNWHGNF